MASLPTRARVARAPDLAAGVQHASLAQRYRSVRQRTQDIVAPLSPEDCVVQSMDDASPAKWHLAHTTWFFETFVLAKVEQAHAPFHPAYSYLFNSYYEAVGERHARRHRGLLTRPSLDEVREYRRNVDARMDAALEGGSVGPGIEALVELGLNHEQQHQELLLTDILHLFSCSPLEVAYAPEAAPAPPHSADHAVWRRSAGGLVTIGRSEPDSGAPGDFTYDNEGPAHRVWLEPFELASRTVTCAEYLAFVEAGGYREARWWLSDGWAWVQETGTQAPQYWRCEADGAWSTFTLRGRVPLDPHAPVMHVSYYEADAYARFRGTRLPREEEWELALRSERAADEATGPCSGEVWEWTMSPYVPYPGYKPASGALGEYNGKFMSNQMVLRGASFATAPGHSHLTYRNFFPPTARWQFSGLRLARDAK